MFPDFAGPSFPGLASGLLREHRPNACASLVPVVTSSPLQTSGDGVKRSQSPPIREGSDMSFRWLVIGFTVIALALSAAAGAASAGSQGVHGAATQSQVNWRLIVNVNRAPTEALTGIIQFFVFDTPLIERAHIEARPIDLVISGDTACVVAEVTGFSGDIGYTPVFLVVNIRDVEGGPDLFSVIVFPSDFIGELPPTCADAISTTIPVEAGNFTIIGDA
jgi:hypothetical protein